MASFGQKINPPSPDEGAEAFVFWLARHEFGCRSATVESALDQDLGIIGDDVDDFAHEIAKRYGEWVYTWPWERFVCLDEGVPLTAPFAAIWEFLRLPWRDSALPRKPTLNRLQLGHIAKVLEDGEWSDP